jgi:outer membrane receptor protein involved in Fe transport
VGASAFVYRVERHITPQATGDDLSVLAFYNADTVEVAGVEFEAERAWVGGWQTAAALTVQEATGRGASGLSNSPKYLGRLRFAGPLWPALVHFGVEALYTGTRDTLAGDEAGGFALGFLTVRTTRPLAGFTLALDIDNLLNRTYGDPGSEEHSMALIPQDGRTLALTASWRF